MFGKDTQEFFPSSKINFLIYSWNEPDEIKLKQRIVINGDLIKEIDRAFELIRINTENIIVMEGLKRTEMSQYPLDAIREALINAVAHRDYSIHNSDIVIRLFDNKLEIINPGGLLEGVDMEQLLKGEHHSIRRNPTISFLFDNLGFMEQSGNGIRVIINAMKKFGLNVPNISADKSYFKIEFYGQKINIPNEKVLSFSTDLTKLLSTKEKFGISIIKEKLSDEFLLKDYMVGVGTKSRITARNHLKKFESMGILKSNKVNKSLVFKKIAHLI